MSQTDRLAHSSFCLNAESVSKNAPCGAELTIIYNLQPRERLAYANILFRKTNEQ